VVLSFAKHRAQPGAQPSKVLSPGTDAKGPWVGKGAAAGGLSGLGGVGGVGRGGLGGGGVEAGEAVPGL
jgi:hypothetical protein